MSLDYQIWNWMDSADPPILGRLHVVGLQRRRYGRNSRVVGWLVHPMKGLVGSTPSMLLGLR